MKNKKFNYINIIFIVVLFLISLLFSYKIMDIIKPDYMFVVDMTKDNEYRLVNSYNNGTTFKLKQSGEYYEADVTEDVTGYSIHLKLKLDEDEKRIKDVEYNGNVLEEKNIIKLTDYSKYDASYENMPLFMINRGKGKKIIISTFIAIIITVISMLILSKENKENKKKKKGFWSIFVYSDTFIKLLNKKDIIILVIVFLITFFIIVGCDAKVIANVGNLFANNVDIYQLQVNTRFITGRAYAEFPYNPLMLCIWGGIMSVFRPITKILPVLGNYPYWEVGVLKLFNFAFIFMTISALLSYFIDNGFIDKKRAKWIYYISLFNPVTFYVAILFVQLDALTLYLIVVGSLLLYNLNDNRFLGIVFLSIGLMLKMQILFLMPLAVILVLYIIYFCSKDKMTIKVTRMLKCIAIFAGITMFTFVLPYILKTPFYYLESNLEQSERMWYTTIQYTSNIYLYITLGVLAGAMILYLLNLRSDIKKETIILSVIIYYAVIILLFSFSIMPTPSVYIVTLGAFVILVALEKDRLRNVILSVVSILIIVCPMLSDYGDISKIFKNPNEQGIITCIIQKMAETNSVTKINSAIFTVSAVGMLIFALYMGRRSICLFENVEKNKY